jgi:hypothetical protein
MRTLIALAVPIPCVVRAQAIDVTGTWVIDMAKSDFGKFPPPSFDTSRVTRRGNQYRVESITDFGGQGPQHIVYMWPVGDGDVINDLPNGATMKTTTKMHGDTITFVSQVIVNGNAVASQTGRMYETAAATLTREVDIQPLVGQSAAPLHFVLVYQRR